MFGLSFDKIALIAVLAAILISPAKLPSYASKLAKLVRDLRRFGASAQDRLREELGPEFDDVDWKKLDPRQYDPRQIVREALLGENDETRITWADDSVEIVTPALPPAPTTPAVSGAAESGARETENR
jgi:sec-independent protein translocase protein TatB